MTADPDELESMRRFIEQRKAEKAVKVGKSEEGYKEDCQACNKPVLISPEVQRRIAVFLSDHAGGTEFFLESEPLEKDENMISREFKVVCGSCGVKHILRVSYRAG